MNSILAGALAASGLAALTTPTFGATDACKGNITHSGGGMFMQAGSVTSHDSFPGVAPAVAMKRIYRYLMKDGWTIASASESMGMLSATKNEDNLGTALNNSPGHPRSFNVEVEAADGGTKVTVTTNLIAGYLYSKKDLVEMACDPLAAIGEP
jgi:hypothetical protein